MPAGGQPTQVAFADGASSVVVASQTMLGSNLYMYGEGNTKSSNDHKQQTKLPLPEIKWEHHKIHDKRGIITLFAATATYGSADGSTVIASCSEGITSVICIPQFFPFFSCFFYRVVVHNCYVFGVYS